MAAKQKAVIFPYDLECGPLIRHANLLNNIEIVGAVSPEGWGFTGKDVGQIDGGDAIGMLVHNDINEMKEFCDAVIFVAPSTEIDYGQVIFPEIKKSIDLGKDIINTIPIPTHEKGKIEEYCKEKNVGFKCYTDDMTSIQNIEVLSEEIQKVHTPIIIVLGTAERTQKFQIQMCLRDNLITKGYTVSQVGSRNYCELLGFHSFPRFMFGNMVDETKKVILFNRYIKKIEAEEKPDLIIIGVPGGIMPMNNIFTNKFGILASEVAHAVRPDAVILSSFFEDYKPENFEMLSTLIKYRFGCEIDCYNIANIKLDWADSINLKSLSYLTLDYRFIEKSKKNYVSLKTPIYTVLNQSEAIEMTNFLVDKLADYSEIQLV